MDRLQSLAVRPRSRERRELLGGSMSGEKLGIFWSDNAPGIGKRGSPRRAKKITSALENTQHPRIRPYGAIWKLARHHGNNTDNEPWITAALKVRCIQEDLDTGNAAAVALRHQLPPRSGVRCERPPKSTGRRARGNRGSGAGPRVRKLASEGIAWG